MGDDGTLFDMKPARKPKEVKPGYRLSRQYMQAVYDTELARFRNHHFGAEAKPGCQECHTARERAAGTGLPFTLMLCTEGYLAFRAYSSIGKRLREGYYPDRAPAVPPAPSPWVQPFLFEHIGETGQTPP